MTRNSNDVNLALKGLEQLKGYFRRIAQNRTPGIPKPLFYDPYWNGIVASFNWNREGGAAADGGECFGNANYNDHMFHYGYIVYAAAMIAHMDPGFLNEPRVVDYVNTLIRDYANPVDDKFFPFSRNFDWWHGHSWAGGLHPALDGKDIESTSEDAMSLLAIKLWGKVTGDKTTEARGNLQLAILKRSLQSYFFWETGNGIPQAKDLLSFKSSGVVSCPMCTWAD
jgi:endo-1,3(4)-beta-glucanase